MTTVGGVMIVVRFVVVVTVMIMVNMAATAFPFVEARAQHPQAHNQDEKCAGDFQPMLHPVEGKSLFQGQHAGRQKKYDDRVGERYGEAKQNGILACAPDTDEICGNQRLAMARLKRVRHAKAECCRQI